MRIQENKENNIVPRMLGVKELTAYLSMGRTKAVEFARECGSEKRIGTRLLFDRNIIDSALDQLGSE